MKCGSMAQFLSDYLDHELDPRFCEKINRHKRLCGPCKDFISSLKMTLKTLKNSSSPRPSSQIRTKLRRALERIEKHSK